MFDVQFQHPGRNEPAIPREVTISERIRYENTSIKTEHKSNKQQESFQS